MPRRLRRRAPVAPGDIAVLVRTNRNAALIREALDAAGVPAVINGAGSVFATAAGARVAALLEALERPASPSRAHAAALTAFLGWSAERVACAADAGVGGASTAACTTGRGCCASGAWPSLAETITVAERLPARVLVRGRRRAPAHRPAPRRPSCCTPRRASRAAGHHRADRLAAPADRRGRPRRRQRGAQPPAGVRRRGRPGADRSTAARASSSRSSTRRSCGSRATSRASRTRSFHDPDPDDARTSTSAARARSSSATAASTLVEQRGEDLRLAYVALTRARHQAVVWWAPAWDSAQLAARPAAVRPRRRRARSRPRARRRRRTPTAVGPLRGAARRRARGASPSSESARGCRPRWSPPRSGRPTSPPPRSTARSTRAGGARPTAPSPPTPTRPAWPASPRTTTSSTTSRDAPPAAAAAARCRSRPCRPAPAHRHVRPPRARGRPTSPRPTSPPSWRRVAPPGPAAVDIGDPAPVVAGLRGGDRDAARPAARRPRAARLRPRRPARRAGLRAAAGRRRRPVGAAHAERDRARSCAPARRPAGRLRGPPGGPGAAPVVRGYLTGSIDLVRPAAATASRSSTTRPTGSRRRASRWPPGTTRRPCSRPRCAAPTTGCRRCSTRSRCTATCAGGCPATTPTATWPACSTCSCAG